MRVLLATTNQGKIAELRHAMAGTGVNLIGLNESESTQMIETGSTFEENALLKAAYYHEATKLPTIADDSGLEVEALGGAPGAYSARYAGPGASDHTRLLKLLDEIRDVPESGRHARFVCAAAFVWKGGHKVVIAEAQGLIVTEPRGSNGFGYDPVFFYEPLNKTFAELTAAEKLAVSHRGIAFRHLSRWLSDSGLLDTPSSTDRIVSTAD